MIAFLPGLLTGLSLIIAIGAQNAFVIRQGLTKQHVLLVVAICAVSDALAIVLGVSGLGAIIQGLPWLLEIIRWFGVAYLTWFGIKSLRSAFKTQSLDASGVQSGTATKVALTVLGVTWLNPHFYLDTVILLGSIGNQFITTAIMESSTFQNTGFFINPDAAFAPNPIEKNQRKLPKMPPAANHHRSSPNWFPIDPRRMTVSR